MLSRLPQAWIIFDKWLLSNANVVLFSYAVFPNTQSVSIRFIIEPLFFTRFDAFDM